MDLKIKNAEENIEKKTSEKYKKLLEEFGTLVKNAENQDFFDIRELMVSISGYVNIIEGYNKRDYEGSHVIGYMQVRAKEIREKITILLKNLSLEKKHELISFKRVVEAFNEEYKRHVIFCKTVEGTKKVLLEFLKKKS